MFEEVSALYSARMLSLEQTCVRTKIRHLPSQKNGVVLSAFVVAGASGECGDKKENIFLQNTARYEGTDFFLNI